MVEMVMIGQSRSLKHPPEILLSVHGRGQMVEQAIKRP